MILFVGDQKNKIILFVSLYIKEMFNNLKKIDEIIQGTYTCRYEIYIWNIFSYLNPSLLITLFLSAWTM